MYNHKRKIDKNSVLKDLAVSLEIPIITPTYLVARPSIPTTLTGELEQSHDSNNTLVILVPIVVIILIIIIGIGFWVYYRRLKRGKENKEIKRLGLALEEDDRRTKRNGDAQKYQISNNSISEYVTKNDVPEHRIDPQFSPNRHFDSVLLELSSSLASGMKPPPTTALPPIPTDTHLSSKHNRPPALTKLTTAHIRNKTSSSHFRGSSVMNPKEDLPIFQSKTVEILSHSKLTQSKPQRKSSLLSRTQPLSYSSETTSNTFSSSTETSMSMSMFGWDDNIDKIYESDSSLSSKCLDIIDSPTLPQHPSVLSAVTKNSSGLFPASQSWSKTSWHNETANDQSYSEHFDPTMYFSSRQETNSK
ncbi:8219_t:CDS:1 [Cetraspora pellucida]|uniref:8219_t:CDS:1 n=1 Tax=Cetraspora pellucida TaxID=1433469 RepID=A0A9N9IIG0_9GLOM|nr:8219_t:CDS:1 [Cetraspora pellucida]